MLPQDMLILFRIMSSNDKRDIERFNQYQEEMEILDNPWYFKDEDMDDQEAETNMARFFETRGRVLLMRVGLNRFQNHED